MNAVSREQITDIVNAAVAEVRFEFANIVRAEFASHSTADREYHAERTATEIKLITGCDKGDYDELNKDLSFLRRFRRGHARFIAVVGASFIGLWAKSFWSEITGILS